MEVSRPQGGGKIQEALKEAGTGKKFKRDERGSLRNCDKMEPRHYLDWKKR